MYQGHAERYGRQAHNLKVAGSNPAPATNHGANNLTSPKNLVTNLLQ